jgi:AraC-like DNA-binding protein
MRLFDELYFFFINLFGKKEQRIKVLFKHHFFINKYYLRHSATADDLSMKLNISNTDLDQLTFTQYNLDFHSLRDMYRFQHFWEEFTNPLNSNLPIQSIISLCGFSSNEEFNHLISGHKELSKSILRKNFL